MAFTARYDGTCPLCQEDITAEVDEIMSLKGEYVHVDCAADESNARPRRGGPESQPTVEICPLCHLQKPCGCEGDIRQMVNQVVAPAASAARLAKMTAGRPAPAVAAPVSLDAFLAQPPSTQDAVEAFFQDNPVPYETLEDVVEAKVKRDQYDRPLILQPDGSELPYNRASSYGGKLDDKEKLYDWVNRQVLRGTAILQRQRPTFLDGVPERLYDPWNDQEPREKDALNSMAEQAKDAAGSNLKSQLGTDIHYATELIDAGDDLENKLSIFEPWRKDLLIERANAYYALVKDLGLKWDTIETFGVQDDHRVAGTWDRRGFVPWWPEHKQTIGDVKTSGSMDFGGLSFGVQLAEYAHMCQYVIETGERIPHEGMNEKWALIIHVDRNKGGPVEAFRVNIEWGWRRAGLAREVIEARKEGKWKGDRAPIQRLDERELLILSQTSHAELLALKPTVDGWPAWLKKVASQRWQELS